MKSIINPVSKERNIVVTNFLILSICIVHLFVCVWLNHLTSKYVINAINYEVSHVACRRQQITFKNYFKKTPWGETTSKMEVELGEQQWKCTLGNYDNINWIKLVLNVRLWFTDIVQLRTFYFCICKFNFS
jgi:hypothetical protein